LSGALAGALFRSHKGLSKSFWGGVGGAVAASAYQLYENRLNLSFETYNMLYPQRFDNSTYSAGRNSVYVSYKKSEDTVSADAQMFADSAETLKKE